MTQNERHIASLKAIMVALVATIDQVAKLATSPVLGALADARGGHQIVAPARFAELIGELTQGIEQVGEALDAARNLPFMDPGGDERLEAHERIAEALFAWSSVIETGALA